MSIVCCFQSLSLLGLFYLILLFFLFMILVISFFALSFDR